MNLSSLSGMQAASQLVDVISRDMANISAPAAEVDLPAQVARLVTAHIAYDANARVQQSQDEVVQAAIDVLA